MIALDTTLLVYAHREDSPWHDAAYARLTELAEGRALWAIPWTCPHEFLAIVTHPRIYAPPTSLAAAPAQVEDWLESPCLMLLTKSEVYWPVWSCDPGQAAGLVRCDWQTTDVRALRGWVHVVEVPRRLPAGLMPSCSSCSAPWVRAGR